jgi:hypothetical protein
LKRNGITGDILGVAGYRQIKKQKGRDSVPHNPRLAGRSTDENGLVRNLS